MALCAGKSGLKISTERIVIRRLLRSVVMPASLLFISFMIPFTYMWGEPSNLLLMIEPSKGHGMVLPRLDSDLSAIC